MKNNPVKCTFCGSINTREEEFNREVRCLTCGGVFVRQATLTEFNAKQAGGSTWKKDK